MTPAPIWEVFHPIDGKPIGYAAAWHWLPAIEAIACAVRCDPRPLDAELLPLEMVGEPSMGVLRFQGDVQLIKRNQNDTKVQK